MDDTGYKRLAASIVTQAVNDWRSLCKGAKETGQCNFSELEYFFEHECESYLTGTSLSADRIYEKLKKEREQAKVK